MMYHLMLHVVLLTILHLYGNKVVGSIVNADKLLRDAGPNLASVRPAEKVKLELSLSLLQLFSVDMVKNEVKASLGVTMRWRDERLAWDAQSNDNKSRIFVPAVKVWSPHLYIIESIDPIKALDPSLGRLAVRPDGTITKDAFQIPVTLSCLMDWRDFPFDQQECRITFSAFPFSTDEIELEWLNGYEYINLDSYYGNRGWSLQDVASTRLYFMFDDNPGMKYGNIAFNLGLSRRQTGLHIVYIGPLVLIGFLTSLLLLLPPQEKQKFVFGGILLLCMLVLLTNLDYFTLTEGHSLPLIGCYFLVVFVMLALVLTIAILSSVLIHADCMPPACLTKVCGLFKKVTFCHAKQSSGENTTEHIKLNAEDTNQPNNDVITRREGGWMMIAVVLERLMFVVFFVLNLICVCIYFAK